MYTVCIAYLNFGEWCPLALFKEHNTMTREYIQRTIDTNPSLRLCVWISGVGIQYVSRADTVWSEMIMDSNYVAAVYQ